jgi:alkyl hydroperoxide reductase subunit D
MSVTSLSDLLGGLPDWAKDTRLNMGAVLQTSTLSAEQRWGVAVAAAATAGHSALLSAVLAGARAQASEAVVEDGLAAASLMAMNNVYYRFRHLVGKESYSEKPARLRMNRLVRPATNRVDFELYSLVASAITGCETCIQAHEKVVLEGGLSEDQVHDAVRIGAVVKAAAASLQMAEAAA